MTERRDPYLDALEQLNTMRDRAFKAENAIRRVRDFLGARDAALDDESRANGHFILVDTDSVRRALDGDAE